MERAYSQIDMDERRKIARWRMAGVSVDVIAEKLGRHRSTIFRELRRNAFTDSQMPDLNGYYCVTANDMARERRAKLRKLARFSHLRQSVIERIMHGWSPQQIAGRLQLERHPISVSHETIYKFAYSPDGHAIKLWRHLPEHRARRRPRHAGRRHAVVSARKSTFFSAPTSLPSANNSGIGNVTSSSFARSSERPM
jgi:IS30 family transposase